MNAMDRDAISGWGAVVHIIEKDKVKLDFYAANNWFQKCQLHRWPPAHWKPGWIRALQTATTSTTKFYPVIISSVSQFWTRYVPNNICQENSWVKVSQFQSRLNRVIFIKQEIPRKEKYGSAFAAVWSWAWWDGWCSAACWRSCCWHCWAGAYLTFGWSWHSRF